jgi:hypothetical protein
VNLLLLKISSRTARPSREVNANMSAETNQTIADFIALFQETWAECQALRAKERIEASGHSANWEECLDSAQTEARELFQPVFSALERDAPLPRVLEQVRVRLESRRSQASPLETSQLR